MCAEAEETEEVPLLVFRCSVHLLGEQHEGSTGRYCRSRQSRRSVGWMIGAPTQNSKETIRVLRQAKYIAALAMTTLPSDKPLSDARHAVVITLSDLVQALETDPAASQQEKIEQARGAIRNWMSALEAVQIARLRRLAEG